MGRWSYVTLQGKSNRRVMFITAYRVCEQHDPGPETAYFQQWTYLRSQGIIDPKPRQQILDDLAQFIKEKTAAGYEVGLSMDGNEPLTYDSALTDFFADTGLFCLHSQLYADDYYIKNPMPSTYKRGRHKIDYQAGTLGLLLWSKRGGWEAFDEGLGGDHRTGFVDFSLTGLLNGKIHDMEPAKQQTLRSTNIKVVREYRLELHRQLQHHNILAQIDRLHHLAQTRPFNKAMQLETERIDRTVKESKIAAERHCKQWYFRNEWSPKLVQHALQQKFWKVLLSSKRHDKDASHVLNRLIAQLPTVSTADLSLTTEQIIEHVKSSRAAYKAAKRNAQSLRDDFLNDLADVWARRGRTDVATAIRCIQESRKTKAAHAFLTSVFKPRQSLGLTMIKVPDRSSSDSVHSASSMVSNHTDTTAPESYEPAVCDNDDIVWKTVVDTDDI